jgi:hypothetical protein
MVSANKLVKMISLCGVFRFGCVVAIFIVALVSTKNTFTEEEFVPVFEFLFHFRDNNSVGFHRVTPTGDFPPPCRRVRRCTDLLATAHAKLLFRAASDWILLSSGSGIVNHCGVLFRFFS